MYNDKDTSSKYLYTLSPVFLSLLWQDLKGIPLSIINAADFLLLHWGNASYRVETVVITVKQPELYFVYL